MHLRNKQTIVKTVNAPNCHCEERSDVAISQYPVESWESPGENATAFPRLHPKGASSRSGRHVGRWPPRNGKAGGFPHSSLFIFQSSGFIHFRAPPLQRTPRQGAKKLRSFDRSFMLALPIFPCSHPQSIVGANELNFCVRDGNRCTLTAINTNYWGHTLKTEQE